MRLKWLTNFNTLLLVTVCIALGATLWWSQRALERPYQLMERYLACLSSSRTRRRAISRPTWAAAMPCVRPPPWRRPSSCRPH